MKIYYMAFGCKVSGYEIQNLAELFGADGHARTESISEADVCVINSCTVTSQADTKLRHFIKRAARENPECLIVLTGCFPQAFPEKAAQFTECGLICGTKDKTRIPELVYEKLSEGGDKALISVKPHAECRGFEPMMNTRAEGKTRAYIKIQDGCDCYCTYCIIPYARGHICSKPLADIRREAAALAASGHRELVITGINICCYGKDLAGGERLSDAVRICCETEGVDRVRLGSIEPEMLTDEDIAEFAACGEKLCPHFHLSLQSGCAKTLAAMKRRYTPQEYYALCEKLRTAFPNCAITTDIMTGFPGETEEDHRESVRFAERVGFASAHIFPYSRRSGTPADRMPGQTDKRTKSRRAAEMSEVCARSRERYLEGFVGKTVRVLFERETDNDFHKGHTPEYVLVKVPYTGGSLWKRLLAVRITSADGVGLYGEVEKS